MNAFELEPDANVREHHGARCGQVDAHVPGGSIALVLHHETATVEPLLERVGVPVFEHLFGVHPLR